MSVGALLNVALSAPDAIAKGKGYANQQREKRNPQIGTHPPGGAPPMRKVSAAQVLREKLMEKKAAGMLPPGAGAHIGQALLTGALMAGGGVALSGAARGVGGAFQRLQAERMFKELQGRYPEIRRHKDARKYFDMTVAYAPSLMRHHAAIGDFLKRQLEYPMSSIEFIQQLATLEGTVSKTMGNNSSTNFGRQSVDQAPLSDLAQRKW